MQQNSRSFLFATCTSSGQIVESYDYNNAGFVTVKQVQMTQNARTGTVVLVVDFLARDVVLLLA
jgi:hypothetical protein